MGAESCEKSESFVATFGRKRSSITLFVHDRCWARKGLCTGLVECEGVLVQNAKVQVTPTRGQEIENGRDAHSREGSHDLEKLPVAKTFRDAHTCRSRQR